MTVVDPIGTAIQGYVDAGAIAGAATLVWRRGRVVRTASFGRRDLTTGLPVERDTIFRIASMTKPVTTVAALMLLEEGRFALDDPIVDYAPELAEMRVLLDPGGALEETVEAIRHITFDDLLTHRSGLTYGDFHRGPIGAAYREALGGTVDNPLSPDEWIARLATLPLIDQPGAGFHYGHSTDLLGFLIARIEGAPLGRVLARRVFAPLGMSDTGFVVPSDKRARRAGLCGFDAEGHLIALAETPGGHAQAERPENMTFESGGQGLWSTLDDYLAFARLFVGGGAVDGVRLLTSGDADANGFQSAYPATAGRVPDVWQAAVQDRSRIRDGRGGGDGTRAGRSSQVWRRRGRRWMAGRLGRLVASRPWRRVRSDLSGAQHGRVAPDGQRHRPGRVERDCEVPGAGVG